MSLRTLLVSFIATSLLAVGIVQCVDAATITYTFKGITDPNPSGFSAAEPFFGTITLDDTVSDQEAGNETFGQYSFTTNGQITVTIAGITFTNFNPVIEIFDRTPGNGPDFFEIVSNTSNASSDSVHTSNSISLSLANASATAIDNDDLTGFNFSSFSDSNFDLFVTKKESGSFFVSGQIKEFSLAASTVPEPATLCIWAGLGMIGFGGALRRRGRVAY